jgi:hypothetical protein
MDEEPLQKPKIEQSGLNPECKVRPVRSCMVMYDERSWTSIDNEKDRIRAVFGLSSDAPLPHANIHTLLTYQRYLAEHLTFPFQALYAETKPPIRQLFHYISVLGLVEGIRSSSEGIVCVIAGIPSIHDLPLAEIGVRQDDPIYLLIDEYASWFLNR